MPLLKQGKLIEDPWIHIPDEVAIPASGPAIISLIRWRAERDALVEREDPLGVRLTADQTAGEVADDLDHLDLIALAFPVYTDGRAYSNARRLRERYGFKGELRAIGNVLRDQYLFMQRCGFDTLEVKEGETEEDWRHAVGAISVAYQPATDDSTTEPAQSLRQRRQAASFKMTASG